MKNNLSPNHIHES